MAGTVLATPICTTDRDDPVQSDSPVQIKCCFDFSMKSKKWKKEQDPPGLSKSGGLHLRTFALPRSVSCSRSAPPPIRKLRAASQTDVLSAGDSGCWDSACMRPRFGSRPPVSTPDPPSLRLALPTPPTRSSRGPVWDPVHGS
jgi:hypothetical protein